MTRYKGESNYRRDTPSIIGILVTNLGTPDAPNVRALRRYLAEFLGDTRVVERPRWKWWPVLHGIILRVRPRRSARLYQKVWTEQGSPLLALSKRLTDKLQIALSERFRGPVKVTLGMRYGNPSIASALENLRQASVRRVLILPLYPQYSATTTATTFDAVADEVTGWRWIPELRTINEYHQNIAYIKALAASIQAAWEIHKPAERIVFSFHGIPKEYAEAGDPYYFQCQATAKKLAQVLGLPEERWALAFQSRFGPTEWLRPYADELLTGWAKSGIEDVEVVCPGFAVDCLETLEEVGQQFRDLFLHAGGKRYHYIPALNDCPAHIQALTELIMRHVQGWPGVGDD